MAITQPQSLPLPRWARALDVFCILFAVVALIVSISGGFRLRAGPVWIGVTTPYPLLLWAIVSGLVRHVAAPQQPLLREAPRRLRDWLHTSAAQEATGTGNDDIYPCKLFGLQPAQDHMVRAIRYKTWRRSGCPSGSAG